MNCPNCGAPFNGRLEKCPYCDTNYFDMSTIDFVNKKPIILKIKMPFGDKIFYLTQLVIPSITTIEAVSNDCCCYSGTRGDLGLSFSKNGGLSTNISFAAIPNKKEELLKIEVKEGKINV